MRIKSNVLGVGNRAVVLACCILVLIIFGIFVLINNSSASAQRAEVITIQNYLAQQICEPPSSTSADSAERALEACKARLLSQAQAIYDTCSSKPNDTEIFQCLADESAKAESELSGSGYKENNLGDSSLHTDDGSNAGKLYSYITIVVMVLSAVGGIAIIASLVIAGIQYATAGDNSGSISKAKTRIVFTLLALGLYLMLFYIVTWLIPSDIVG